MRFHTTIEQTGKTACGIHVPEEVVESLGAGKRPAVRVTIKGFTYRPTVAVMGGGVHGRGQRGGSRWSGGPGRRRGRRGHGAGHGAT